MLVPKSDLCTVHVMGGFMQGNGVMLLDNESLNEIRCFVCGKKVDSGEIVVMSLSPEDMVCVCKRHLKHRYPRGTFDDQPFFPEEIG